MNVRHPMGSLEDDRKTGCVYVPSVNKTVVTINYLSNSITMESSLS